MTVRSHSTSTKPAPPNGSRTSQPVNVSAIDQKLRLLSATIDLQVQLDRCHDLAGAADVVVRRCGESLGCGRVVLAWRDDPESSCRVIGDSDEGASAGNTSRFLQAAIEEVASRSAATAWPSIDDQNRHALLAVEQFAKQISAKNMTAVPLREASGRSRGAILAIDMQNPNPTAPLLETIEMPLVGKLISLRRSEPSRLEQMVRKITAGYQSMRRRVVLSIVTAITLLMLLPVRYKVRADCELQPVRRRFIAAPLDGPLSRVLVRPGDTVGEGDLLATINPREIEYELAGLRAEWNRADQERKGLVAKHDFAASKIASLQSQRLQSQASLLEYRRNNLEIRSPISGVVVAGDLQQAEGTPVTQGETLFEVAPLGKMIVEVAIPEHEWSSVRAGMPVKFQLHALPGETKQGVLDRVHPRAELRDQDNVFIAEAVIEDPDGLLRPGMRGRSWIAGDRHPWGWNLFHHAYDSARLTIRSTLGW